MNTARVGRAGPRPNRGAGVHPARPRATARLPRGRPGRGCVPTT